MLNIEYVRSLNSNYERIQLDKVPEERNSTVFLEDVRSKDCFPVVCAILTVAPIFTMISLQSRTWHFCMEIAALQGSG